VQNTLGSIVEVTEGGRKPWQLPSGKERTFVENGDPQSYHELDSVGAC
jgi:hypothetical protein